MGTFIELSNNLENLQLTKIKEILPNTIEKANANNSSFVEILIDLTNAILDRLVHHCEIIKITGM